MEILFLLVAGHALADFGLQSDWMATSKVRKNSPYWFHALSSHALIQGLTVYLATKSLTLGLLETFVHGLIDFGKGEGFYGFHFDQALHIGCRILWYVLLTMQLV